MRWTHAVVVFVLTVLATPAFAKPRLSIAEARKVALARVPGKIVHEKLKKKKKGHDRYNFKIVPLTNAKLHFVEKVSIDGDTGKILTVKQVADKTEQAGKGKKPKSDDDDDNSD
jgi:Peptidase propeptide and YPEB domain